MHRHSEVAYLIRTVGSARWAGRGAFAPRDGPLETWNSRTIPACGLQPAAADESARLTR